MTETTRPPYRGAVLVGLLVLLGYLTTLAPTVTFWDAGELIAAAKTLGIPHPPGTPLWVIIAHVWGELIPFGDYAWRINLLSAVCGAAAAALWYLVTFTLFRRSDQSAPISLVHSAGVAAAVLSAFSFTNWQNAMEAEVYSVAMLTIAALAYSAVRWCALRDAKRGSQLLLFIAYLGAISIGNHLLALLIGPALVALLMAESIWRPLADPELLRRERARILLVAASWLLLIALGLGSTKLTLVTGLLVLLASIFALKNRQTSFLVATLIIIVVGITPYLYLYFRAQQGPYINEADPSTWDALLAVIRRAQYPVRTPLDDPTVFHGPQNPGRTLTILGYQIANYFQYYDWQWARSLGDGVLTSIPRLIVTIGALLTGAFGAVWQWRRDRAGALFLAMAFLVTGLGLVLYMNFKPGPSIGYGPWPNPGDHEVRERDYFFVASFVVWAAWVAIGLSALVRSLLTRFNGARWPAVVFAFVLIPPFFNLRDSSRNFAPVSTLARDFSRALLNSVPPGGILFTWGDNDTFPLWHAQAVDGIRPDVTIVCLALAETPWYQKQLREMSSTAIDQSKLPAMWRGLPSPPAGLQLHKMDDAQIMSYRPQLADRDYELPLPNGASLKVPQGSEIRAKDILLFAVVGENAGRRPISWAVTTRQKLFGAPVIQQGLVFTMPITMPDEADVDFSNGLGAETPIDVKATTSLMNDVWQFDGVLAADVTQMDMTSRSMTSTMAMPYLRLAVALLARGDTTTAIRNLQSSAVLAPAQAAAIEQYIEGIRSGGN